MGSHCHAVFCDDPNPRPVQEHLRKAKQLTRKGLIRQMLHPIGYIRGYLWNKVFRRDVIERLQLRFDEQMSIMEDELFTATYVMATRHFLYTGHPAYHHVVRRDSATQSLGVLGAIRSSSMRCGAFISVAPCPPLRKGY